MIEEPTAPRAHPGRGLLIGGAATFAFFYPVGVAVGVMAAKNANLSPYGAFLPIVGPLLYIGESKGAFKGVLEVVCSVGQLTGALLLIIGGSKSSDTASTRVVPMVGATNGIAVVGVF